METTIDSVIIEINSSAENSSKGLQTLIDTLDKLNQKISPVLSNLDNLKSKLDKTGNSVDKINSKANNTKGVDKFATALTKLVNVGALVGGLKVLYNVLGDTVTKSNDYIENLNLFYVSMGKNADKAKEFADNFSNVLGVDPSKVMRYMGVFNTLAEGFGLSSDKAYVMSKNLTQLSYDMSSFLNIPIEQAMQKIKSGFSGEIEPMRAVGVALDQATLQETAYRLGLEQKVSEMTRAQKSQLLYYQMMTKTTTMQGDMARTLLQPANAIRVLKEQFTLFARAVGNIFIPMLTATIPYLMILTKWLTAAAQAIANLFGFKIDTSAWKSSLDGVSAGIEDVGDSTKGTNKELKKMLAQFDELNVIDFGKDSSKGSGSGGASGGELDIPLPEYDALTGALSKNLDEVEAKLKGILPLIGMIGAALLVIKGIKILSNLAKLTNELGLGAKALSTINGAITVLKGTLAVLVGMMVGFSLSSFIDWISNGNQELENTIKIISVVLEVGGGIIALMTGNWLVALGLFGAAIGTIVQDITNANNKVDIFRGVSEKTQSALQTTYDALTNTDEMLKDLHWNNIAPSDENIATLQKNVDTIIGEYIRLAAEQYAQQKAQITSNLTLSQEEKDEMLRILASSYEKQVEEAKADEQRLNEEINKLKNASAEDIAKYYDDILGTLERYAQSSTEIVTNNEDETAKIKSNYNQQKVNNEKEALSTMLQSSIENRDKTIKAAEEKYNTDVNNAEEAYKKILEKNKDLTDEQKELFEKAKDSSIKQAELERDNAIRIAKERHLGLVKEAKKENSEILKDMDLSTGKQKNMWVELGKNILANITPIGSIGKAVYDLANNFDTSFSETNIYIKGTENELDNLSASINENANDLNFYDQAYAGLGDTIGDLTSIEQGQKGFQDLSDDVKGVINELSNLQDAGNNLTFGGYRFTVDWIYSPEANLKAAQAAGLKAIPRIRFQKYADGGFPEMGEMFIARENGPELVGNIGRKSAVANNDQIIEGIRQGVSQGVAEAMPSQQRGPINVYVGNRKVYSGYGEYANEENNMYGTNVIRV